MILVHSNPVNTTTEGAIESVNINSVSVLSRLNLRPVHVYMEVGDPR